MILVPPTEPAHLILTKVFGRGDLALVRYGIFSTVIRFAELQSEEPTPLSFLRLPLTFIHQYDRLAPRLLKILRFEFFPKPNANCTKTKGTRTGSISTASRPRCPSARFKILAETSVEGGDTDMAWGCMAPDSISWAWRPTTRETRSFTSSRFELVTFLPARYIPIRTWRRTQGFSDNKYSTSPRARASKRKADKYIYFVVLWCLDFHRGS